MFSDKYLRIGFWMALILGVSLHVWTLPYSSNHWQDEAQICEIGRRVYEKTDWNMYKMPDPELDTVAPGIWLVGPIAQETSYRVLGHLGPKIAALFYLVIATILLRFYHKRKTGDMMIATVVPLLFFAAPGVVQSVRGARVDILAFMMLFASLSILQLKPKSEVSRNLIFACCGSLSALCVFTWPTAILTMPIVLWEMIECYRVNAMPFMRILSTLSFAMVGGVAFSAASLLPTFVNPELSAKIYTLLSHSSMDSERSIKWLPMAREMTTSLGVYLIGAVSLVLCRRNFMLLLGGVAYFVICAASSRIYVFKTVYFLPYVIIGLAIFWHSISRRSLKIVVVVAACTLMVACYGRSVILRNSVEYFARPYRDVGAQIVALSKYIQKSEKVWNCSWQSYFPLRMLGVDQYQHYFGCPTAEEWSQYDCVLMEKDSRSNSSYIKTINEHGFTMEQEISIDAGVSTAITEYLDEHGHLLPLGPYYLFKRDPSGDKIPTRGNGHQ